MKLKPYPKYRDSGAEWLGEIPSHWEMIRTKYIFHEVDERSKLGEETHLSMSQIHGLVESSKIDTWRLHSESYAGGKLCRKNDLVLNRLKAHLGVFAYAPLDGIVSPDYTVFRIKEGNEVRFFETLFKTPTFIGELRCFTKGIVEGFWRLYSDDFYKIRIPIPSEEEQVAILRWIKWFDGKINRFIRNKRSLIKLLNEQKQVIINQAITRGLDPSVSLKPSSIPYLRDVPTHWEVCRLKRVITPIEQGWSPQCESQPAELQEWGVLKVGCVNGELFNEKENKKLPDTLTPIPELEIKEGDVLVSRANTRELVGLAALVETVRPKLMLCDKTFRFQVKLDDVSPKYLVLVLRSIPSREQIESEANGASSSMLNIGQDTIWNLWVSLPPLHEQNEILEYISFQISDLNKTINHTQREIELIQEYRTRLISDVVTGKTDVRDIEIPDLLDEDVVEELEDEELLEEAEAELEEAGNTDE